MHNIIDFHHHWMPRLHVEQPELFMRPGEAINEVRLIDGQVTKRISRDGMHLITMAPARWTIDDRLERMDEARVTAAVLTLGTWVSFVEDLRTCQYVNDEMAKVVQSHPERLLGGAHIPLSPSKEAARELERCIKDLGFVALSTVTNIRGMFPDHPLYYPLYEVAEEYGVPVIVHAPGCPVDEPSLRDYDLSRTIGREVEHTIAVARVLLSEVPTRFPRLKFVHCHLGGTFWASTFRYGRPGNALESRTIAAGGAPTLTPEEFQRRTRNFYFNTTFWEPRVIKFAIETLGEDQVVFGTDYPIRTSLLREMREALEGLGLSSEAQKKIAYQNASTILGSRLPHPVGEVLER